jgi:hypothetical protein
MNLRALVPLVGLVLSITLGACDPGSSSSRSAAGSDPVAGSTSAAVRPASVDQVFTTTDTTLLSVWARDDELAPELRLAALRRLEELRAPETVAVASELAREAPGLVHDSAVGVLVRCGTPEAQAALASLDSDSQSLARSLAAGAR